MLHQIRKMIGKNCYEALVISFKILSSRASALLVWQMVGKKYQRT